MLFHREVMQREDRSTIRFASMRESANLENRGIKIFRFQL